MGVRLCAGALALGNALLSGTSASAAQTESLEYAVKANYLVKLTPFVTWPPSTFSDPDSPFTLCVAGDDPFGPALDDAARGQKVGEHPIVVHRLHRAEARGNCQLVYGRAGDAPWVGDFLKSMAARPVLTVTEEGMDNAPGIVRFVIRDGRVRFEVDEAGARSAGLQISSKLLALSVSHRRPTP